MLTQTELKDWNCLRKYLLYSMKTIASVSGSSKLYQNVKLKAAFASTSSPFATNNFFSYCLTSQQHEKKSFSWTQSKTRSKFTVIFNLEPRMKLNIFCFLFCSEFFKVNSLQFLRSKCQHYPWSHRLYSNTKKKCVYLLAVFNCS